MSGKGDNLRPSSVSRDQYESNWDKIFNPKAKRAKKAVAKKVKPAKKAVTRKVKKAKKK